VGSVRILLQRFMAPAAFVSLAIAVTAVASTLAFGGPGAGFIDSAVGSRISADYSDDGRQVSLPPLSPGIIDEVRKDLDATSASASGQGDDAAGTEAAGSEGNDVDGGSSGSSAEDPTAAPASPHTAGSNPTPTPTAIVPLPTLPPLPTSPPLPTPTPPPLPTLPPLP
jgi:hypothetical protein